MSQRPDPYTVLGIPPGSSPTTVRRAYLARARTAHPDLVGEGGLATMQRINAAWDTLRDPERRAAYDASAGYKGLGASTTSPGGRNPGWTGAAGRPPGRPSGSLLDFGIFAGWSLGEIARHDAGYLQWLSERREGARLADEIQALLRQMRGQATAPSGKVNGARRWRR